MMHIYNFLGEALVWIGDIGLVLSLLGAGAAIISGRGRESLPLIGAGACVLVLTSNFAGSAWDAASALRMTEHLKHLASMPLPLLGFAFIAAFCSVAFLPMLKKLLE